jgi:hypothetical protein
MWLSSGASPGIKKFFPIFSMYFFAFLETISLLVHIDVGMSLSVQNPAVKGVFEPIVMSKIGIVKKL